MAVYMATTHCPAWCANQVGLLWGGKGHWADTKKRRSTVGIWEYGCPGLVEMKTHLQTKRAQYPEERPARWDHGAAGFSFQTYYQYRSRRVAIDHWTPLRRVRAGGRRSKSAPDGSNRRAAIKSRGFSIWEVKRVSFCRHTGSESKFHFFTSALEISASCGLIVVSQIVKLIYSINSLVKP